MSKDTQFKRKGENKKMADYVYGACGPKAHWKFDGSTLTIFGEGETWDYIQSVSDTEDTTEEYIIRNQVRQPWYNYCGSIKTVSVEENITYLGRGLFCFLNASADQDDSTTYANSYNISTLIFEGNSKLKEIGKYCFYKNTIAQKSESPVVIPSNVKLQGYCFAENDGIYATLGEGVILGLAKEDSYNFNKAASITINSYIQANYIGLEGQINSETKTEIIVNSLSSYLMNTPDIEWEDKAVDRNNQLYKNVTLNNTSLSGVTKIRYGFLNNLKAGYEYTGADSLTEVDVDSVYGASITGIQWKNLKINQNPYSDKIGWLQPYGTATRVNINDPVSVDISNMIKIPSHLFANTESLIIARQDNGQTLKYIGKYAFYNCTLQSFDAITGGVQYRIRNIRSIKAGAFQNCTFSSGSTLKLIDNKLEEIEEYAFKGITGLEKIDLLLMESTTATVAKYYGTHYITTIKDEAFANCTNLKYAIMPRDVENLGKGIFSGCTALINGSVPSESIDTVPESYFENCNNLTNIYRDLGEYNGNLENSLFYKDNDKVSKDDNKPYSCKVIEDTIIWKKSNKWNTLEAPAPTSATSLDIKNNWNDREWIKIKNPENLYTKLYDASTQKYYWRLPDYYKTSYNPSVWYDKGILTDVNKYIEKNAVWEYNNAKDKKHFVNGWELVDTLIDNDHPFICSYLSEFSNYLYVKKLNKYFKKQFGNGVWYWEELTEPPYIEEKYWKFNDYKFPASRYYQDLNSILTDDKAYFVNDFGNIEVIDNISLNLNSTVIKTGEYNPNSYLGYYRLVPGEFDSQSGYRMYYWKKLNSLQESDYEIGDNNWAKSGSHYYLSGEFHDATYDTTDEVLYFNNLRASNKNDIPYKYCYLTDIYDENAEIKGQYFMKKEIPEIGEQGHYIWHRIDNFPTTITSADQEVVATDISPTLWTKKNVLSENIILPKDFLWHDKKEGTIKYFNEGWVKANTVIEDKHGIISGAEENPYHYDVIYIDKVRSYFLQTRFKNEYDNAYYYYWKAVNSNKIDDSGSIEKSQKSLPIDSTKNAYYVDDEGEIQEINISELKTSLNNYLITGQDGKRYAIRKINSKYYWTVMTTLEGGNKVQPSSNYQCKKWGSNWYLSKETENTIYEWSYLNDDTDIVINQPHGIIYGTAQPNNEYCGQRRWGTYYQQKSLTNNGIYYYWNYSPSFLERILTEFDKSLPIGSDTIYYYNNEGHIKSDSLRDISDGSILNKGMDDKFYSNYTINSKHYWTSLALLDYNSIPNTLYAYAKEGDTYYTSERTIQSIEKAEWKTGGITEDFYNENRRGPIYAALSATLEYTYLYITAFDTYYEAAKTEEYYYWKKIDTLPTTVTSDEVKITSKSFLIIPYEYDSKDIIAFYTGATGSNIAYKQADEAVNSMLINISNGFHYMYTVKKLDDDYYWTALDILTTGLPTNAYQCKKYKAKWYVSISNETNQYTYKWKTVDFTKCCIDKSPLLYGEEAYDKNFIRQTTDETYYQQILCSDFQESPSVTCYGWKYLPQGLSEKQLKEIEYEYGISSTDILLTDRSLPIEGNIAYYVDASGTIQGIDLTSSTSRLFITGQDGHKYTPIYNKNKWYWSSLTIKEGGNSVTADSIYQCKLWNAKWYISKISGTEIDYEWEKVEESQVIEDQHGIIYGTSIPDTIFYKQTNDNNYFQRRELIKNGQTYWYWNYLGNSGLYNYYEKTTSSYPTTAKYDMSGNNDIPIYYIEEGQIIWPIPLSTIDINNYLITDSKGNKCAIRRQTSDGTVKFYWTIMTQNYSPSYYHYILENNNYYLTGGEFLSINNYLFQSQKSLPISPYLLNADSYSVITSIKDSKNNTDIYFQYVVYDDSEYYWQYLPERNIRKTTTGIFESLPYLFPKGGIWKDNDNYKYYDGWKLISQVMTQNHGIVQYQPYISNKIVVNNNTVFEQTSFSNSNTLYYYWKQNSESVSSVKPIYQYLETDKSFPIKTTSTDEVAISYYNNNEEIITENYTINNNCINNILYHKSNYYYAIRTIANSDDTYTCYWIILDNNSGPNKYHYITSNNQYYLTDGIFEELADDEIFETDQSVYAPKTIIIKNPETSKTEILGHKQAYYLTNIANGLDDNNIIAIDGYLKDNQFYWDNSDTPTLVTNPQLNTIYVDTKSSNNHIYYRWNGKKYIQDNKIYWYYNTKYQKDTATSEDPGPMYWTLFTPIQKYNYPKSTGLLSIEYKNNKPVYHPVYYSDDTIANWVDTQDKTEVIDNVYYVPAPKPDNIYKENQLVYMWGTNLYFIYKIYNYEEEIQETESNETVFYERIKYYWKPTTFYSITTEMDFENTEKYAEDVVCKYKDQYYIMTIETQTDENGQEKEVHTWDLTEIIVQTQKSLPCQKTSRVELDIDNLGVPIAKSTKGSGLQYFYFNNTLPKKYWTLADTINLEEDPGDPKEYKNFVCNIGTPSPRILLKMNASSYEWEEINSPKVKIPKNIVTVGKRAFYNTAISYIDFNMTLKILAETCRNCINLENIYLKQITQFIGEHAFNNTVYSHTDSNWFTLKDSDNKTVGKLLLITPWDKTDRQFLLETSDFNLNTLVLSTAAKDSGVTDARLGKIRLIAEKAFNNSEDSGYAQRKAIKYIQFHCPLVYINDQACADLNELKAIRLYTDNPPAIGENVFSHKIRLGVPDGQASNYRNADGWKSYIDTIEEGEDEE